MTTGVLVFFALSSLLSVAISEKIMLLAPSHNKKGLGLVGQAGVGRVAGWVQDEWGV